MSVRVERKCDADEVNEIDYPNASVFFSYRMCRSSVLRHRANSFKKNIFVTCGCVGEHGREKKNCIIFQSLNN
jgi:hypothetical protein